MSEEKVTELEEEGVQCPGARSFGYAISFNKDEIAELPNKATQKKFLQFNAKEWVLRFENSSDKGKIKI